MGDFLKIILLNKRETRAEHHIPLAAEQAVRKPTCLFALLSENYF